MCGRARCTIRADGIPRACIRHGRSVRSVDMDRYRPSYNVSPGWNMPVIRRGDTDDEVVLHCMKWGLVPSFTKKTEKPDHYKMFNARSESISEKPSFRRLVPNNRCLVVVEGFYEWKKDGSKKQPYYIHFKSSQPLVFAALYDYWKNSEGEVLYTFTILTTSSSSALRWLHDRMPVILGDEKAIDAWLDGSTSKFDGVLKPYEEPELVWYPVTAAMGKSSFDGPQCIQEVKLKTEAARPISNFFTKRESDIKESNTEVEESVTHLSDPCQPKHLKEEPENVDLQRLVEDCHQKNLKKEPDTFDSRETKEPNGKKESDEHENGDKQQTQPHISKEEPDIQSSSSIKEPGPEEHHIKKECDVDHADLSEESILRSPGKRAHEISTVKENSNCQTEKQHRSPLKKKGKTQARDYKQQPTLFSYFGKR